MKKITCVPAVLKFVFFANVNGQRTINVDFNKSSGKLNAM